MNLKRWISFMTMDPNCSDGLVIRAEMMEEDAEKLDGKRWESKMMYARLLRELSLKGWSIEQNREFIRENMSEGSPRRYQTPMPSKYMRIIQIIVGVITFWWSWNYITGLIEQAGRTI